MQTRPRRYTSGRNGIVIAQIVIVLLVVLRMDVRGVGSRVNAAVRTGQSSPIVSDASASFSTQIFARAALQKNDVSVSPSSIVRALGMVLAGATEGSPTRVELEEAIGMDEDKLSEIHQLSVSSDEDVEVVVANSVWNTRSLRPEYISNVKRLFDADAQPLPRSSDPINDWVSRMSRGKIPSIIDEIPKNTVAVLLNVLYFRAAWKCKFDPRDTALRPFYVKDAEGELVEKSVSTMRARDARLRYGEIKLRLMKGSARLVEVPYGSTGRYSALVVLPDPGTDIEELVAEVPDLDDWIRALSVSPRVISMFDMPSFKLEYGPVSLKGELNGLGVSKMWDARVQGKFRRMSADETLYISDVIHRVVIEVSEEGTTAAAASAVMIKTRSAQPRRLAKFVVDRAFLFIVRDSMCRIPLFLARVDDPEG